MIDGEQGASAFPRCMGFIARFLRLPPPPSPQQSSTTTAQEKPISSQLPVPGFFLNCSADASGQQVTMATEAGYVVFTVFPRRDVYNKSTPSIAFG